MGEKPMKQSTKRTVGWGGGAALALVVFTFALVTAINSGGMKNLHGQDLRQASAEDVSAISPAAGQQKEEAQTCGDYSAWLGQKVDESAVAKSGKIYRILPPHSMMTMDHNPQRINVHTDDDGIIVKVTCG